MNKSQIKKFISNNIGLIILTFIVSTIATVASLIAPWVVGRAVAAIPNFDVMWGTFMICVISLGCLYAIGGVLTYIYTRYSYELTQRLNNQMRLDVFDKLYKLPIKTMDNTPHGQILSLILSDIENVGEGIYQVLTTFFSGIVTIIGTVGIVLTIDWKIGLVVIGLTPISILLSYFLTKTSKKYFKVNQSNLAKLNSKATESYSNIKLVISYDYQDKMKDNLDAINNDLFHSYDKAIYISSIPNPTSRVVSYIVYVIAGVMGILFKLSIGDITSLLLYTNQFNRPFNDITSVVTQLQSARASYARITHMLEGKEEDIAKEINTCSNAKGNIEFKNVYFSYNTKPLLENLNLKVDSGKRIAIVGPTGSGKTTMINLIMRFYEVNSGQILLDGVDIATIGKDCLRSQIGMVLQESYLFRGTIAENIAYGASDISKQDVEEAAKKAYCHEFIQQLKDGYDTIIENNGDIFSQGQRQLLCIARVMAKLPPILILDEATSNIDTRTEKLIQSAFAKMMKNRTTFVIAHRLSTIKDADKILVMVAGNVVEQGSHDELMSLNGVYRELYNSQYSNADIV